MEKIFSHIFHFSARLVTAALESFEIFEYPWDVISSMFLLLCLLAVVRVWLGIEQLFENTYETGSVATQAPASSTAATQSPAMGDSAAEPADKSMQVSAVLVNKKLHTQNSAHSVEEDEEGPPGEQEEEVVTEVFTRSLSLRDLRDMRKDFRRHPGEHITTWLLRCRDTGAGSLELDGRKAKLLTSLSREAGIDQAIGTQIQVLSLWSRLLSSVKERYPFKKDTVCSSSKWRTVDSGIQYLRELAVLEIIYHDPDKEPFPENPDEVKCTGDMWQRFVQSAPPLYAGLLAELTWDDEEAPTVDEVAQLLLCFYTG